MSSKAFLRAHCAVLTMPEDIIKVHVLYSQAYYIGVH